MNIHVGRLEPDAYPATTRAAEGSARRKWTVDEIDRLSELAVFGGVGRPRERFELIGGEIVPMAAKGASHENVKFLLNARWGKLLPEETIFAPETTLRQAPHDFREPDFVFWPRAVPIRQLSPGVVQLLVEISDSSLDYDLGHKAAYYSGLGIPDYWVIDARRLITHIHREPGGKTWGSRTEHQHTSLLTPLLIPALAVRLADLGLAPVVE